MTVTPLPATRHIIRIIIGLVFIISSVFKFIGIDAFEVYIFSLQWFNLPISTIIARLIISLECILGVLLISNIYFKYIYRITFALLIVFSLFLLLRMLTGNTNNCHCFGEIVQLSPLQAIIKNIVLLAGLVCIKKDTGFSMKHGSSIALFVLVFSIAFPMLYTPPYFTVSYPQMNETSLSIASKRAQHNPVLQNHGAGEGKKIICMLSVSCTYCINAAHKISIIAENNHLNKEILFVFTGDENQLPEFWNKSAAKHFDYVFLPMRDFFSIAGPSVPSIYLSDNGTFQQQFIYKNIDEHTIITFLGK